MNQKKLFSRKIIMPAVALLILLVVAVVVIQKTHNSVLTAGQIAEKFNCNRITADARKTDVFCGNPKFYNDPDGVTYDEYYKWLSCAERLSSEPPAESNLGMYESYYNCKDPTKLNNMRLEFINRLKKLKLENS